MKKFILFFSFLVCFSVQFVAQKNSDKALSFIHQLEREQFDSCVGHFDTVLSNKVNAEMLSKIWYSFPKYFGDYSGLGEVKSESKDTLERVTILCLFERVKINLNLVYTPQQKIVGINFVPAGSTKAYKFPDYAKLNAFTEQKVMLESGKYKLPGVLCLPNLGDKKTIVLLLAGSGPNDKDESIGPNKILKDIALGLASQGIGSLRYDKRTLVYGEELKTSNNNLGIEEEVIEDALNAIKLLDKHSETKSSSIVVIGHILGGMCAPLIAKKSSKVKGVVLMAANARPLEDLILEQLTYIYSLDSLDADEKLSLIELQKQIQVVKDPIQLKAASSENLPSLIKFSVLDLSKPIQSS